MVRKLKKKNDPIISNEYIWGSGNKRIALAVSELDKIQKDALGVTIQEIQKCQGILYEKLTVNDQELFNLAKK